MAKATPGGTGKYRQGPGMRRFLRRRVLDETQRRVVAGMRVMGAGIEKAARRRPVRLLTDGGSGAVRAEGAHDVPHVRDADVEPAGHGNRLVIAIVDIIVDIVVTRQELVRPRAGTAGTGLDDLRSTISSTNGAPVQADDPVLGAVRGPEAGHVPFNPHIIPAKRGAQDGRGGEVARFVDGCAALGRAVDVKPHGRPFVLRAAGGIRISPACRRSEHRCLVRAIHQRRALLPPAERDVLLICQFGGARLLDVQEGNRTATRIKVERAVHFG